MSYWVDSDSGLTSRQAAANRRAAAEAYVVHRQAEAEHLTRQARKDLDELTNVLAPALKVRHRIAFESLKEHPASPLLNESQLPPRPQPPVPWDFPATGSLASRFGLGQARERARAEADARFRAAQAQFEIDQKNWQERMEATRREHARLAREAHERVSGQHRQIDALRAAFYRGEPAAVVDYFRMVMRNSYLPAGIPHKFDFSYDRTSKTLLVEQEIVAPDVLPTIRAYRLVKSTDTISPRPFEQAELNQTYRDLVSSMVLRTLYEIFDADDGRGIVQSVAYNGLRTVRSPATGQREEACLASLLISQDEFRRVRLDAVHPHTCLLHLRARLNLSMTDVRSVERVGSASGFAADPGVPIGSEEAPTQAFALIDMEPIQFEQLIAQLFTRMGFPAQTTQATRDGGIDVLATDPRPIVGGRIVIQVKRYRSVVAPTEVRALEAVTREAGATKGILVTTSRFGPESRRFAESHSLELIDGEQLASLLREHGLMG